MQNAQPLTSANSDILNAIALVGGIRNAISDPADYGTTFDDYRVGSGYTPMLISSVNGTSVVGQPLSNLQGGLMNSIAASPLLLFGGIALAIWYFRKG
jgi:hypothetical protein